MNPTHKKPNFESAKDAIEQARSDLKNLLRSGYMHPDDLKKKIEEITELRDNTN